MVPCATTSHQLFCRPWTLNGITPRLIESHYENNYGGALARLNAITEELETLDPNDTGSGHKPAEARREHRAQFHAAARTVLRQPGWRRPRAARPDRRGALSYTSARSTAGAGSSWRWRTALAGGSGWVLLTYVPRDGRLDQPERLGPSARASPAASRSWRSTCMSMPITSSSGRTPTAYIAAFMRNIEWNAVRGPL